RIARITKPARDSFMARRPSSSMERPYTPLRHDEAADVAGRRDGRLERLVTNVLAMSRIDGFSSSAMTAHIPDKRGPHTDSEAAHKPEPRRQEAWIVRPVVRE